MRGAMMWVCVAGLLPAVTACDDGGCKSTEECGEGMVCVQSVCRDSSSPGGATSLTSNSSASDRSTGATFNTQELGPGEVSVGRGWLGGDIGELSRVDAFSDNVSISGGGGMPQTIMVALENDDGSTRAMGILQLATAVQDLAPGDHVIGPEARGCTWGTTAGGGTRFDAASTSGVLRVTDRPNGDRAVTVRATLDQTRQEMWMKFVIPGQASVD